MALLQLRATVSVSRPPPQAPSSAERLRRPDAEELKAVRRGSLTFDALLEQTEGLGSRLKALAEASALPARPDEDRLNVFCAELMAAVHARTA
jgi:hypothetical protein